MNSKQSIVEESLSYAQSNLDGATCLRLREAHRTTESLIKRNAVIVIISMIIAVAFSSYMNNLYRNSYRAVLKANETSIVIISRDYTGSYISFSGKIDKADEDRVVIYALDEHNHVKWVKPLKQIRIFMYGVPAVILFIELASAITTLLSRNRRLWNRYIKWYQNGRNRGETFQIK